MNVRAAILILLAASLAVAEEPVISPAVPQDGILVHEVRCEFQQGTTQIKVLLPSTYELDHKYPVVYVLPVEA